MKTPQDTPTRGLYDEISQQLALGARFTIVSRIGCGGMGDVFKARDNILERDVAIKVLSGGARFDVASNQRFEREAKVLAELRHPGIVRLHGYGISQCGPYQIFDFLDGHNLAVRLKRGTLDLDEFALVFTQIVDALRYASQRGIVHRDIKPANIFLCMEPTGLKVVLLDFGIVRVIKGDEETITATKSIIGSPAYMSPEQCRGLAVDFRSDIYSLGCVMYECLAGSPPFKSDSLTGLLFKHINSDVPRLNAYRENAACNSRLSELIFQCMQKSPDCRPQSFDSLATSMQEALEHDSGLRFIAPLRKSNPMLIPTMLTTLALLVTAGTLAMQIQRPGDDAVVFAVGRKDEQERENLERSRLRLRQASESERPGLATILIDKLVRRATMLSEEGRFEEADTVLNEALSYAPQTRSRYYSATLLYYALAHASIVKARKSEDRAKKDAYAAALKYTESAVIEADKTLTLKSRIRAMTLHSILLIETGNILQGAEEGKSIAELAIANSAHKMIGARADEYQNYLVQALRCLNQDTLSTDERLALCDLQLAWLDVFDSQGKLAAGKMLLQGAEEQLSACSSQGGIDQLEFSKRDKLLREYRKLIRRPE